MRFRLLLFFGLFAWAGSYAQLQRKALLGAQLEYVTQSGVSGCRVLKVSKATAVALKLQENDIILKIGDSTFASSSEFGAMFSRYQPGQSLRLLVLRGKKKTELKATVQPRPFETDDNAEVIYDQAPFKSGLLRVIINKPKTQSPMPGMLYSW